MTTLLFLSWMIVGAAACGLFLVVVQMLVNRSEKRKAAKRAAFNRRVGLVLGKRP